MFRSILARTSSADRSSRGGKGRELSAGREVVSIQRERSSFLEEESVSRAGSAGYDGEERRGRVLGGWEKEGQEGSESVSQCTMGGSICRRCQRCRHWKHTHKNLEMKVMIKGHWKHTHTNKKSLEMKVKIKV